MGKDGSTKIEYITLLHFCNKIQMNMQLLIVTLNYYNIMLILSCKNFMYVVNIFTFNDLN